ncbi:hypothetical protein VTJ04DRAFT_4869 [Mycothermus thermophilus]
MAIKEFEELVDDGVNCASCPDF